MSSVNAAIWFTVKGLVAVVRGGSSGFGVMMVSTTVLIANADASEGH